MYSGSNITSDGGVLHPQYADLSKIKKGKVSFTNAADGRIIELSAKEIKHRQKAAEGSVTITLTDIKSKKTIDVSIKVDELAQLGLHLKEVEEANRAGTLAQAIDKKIQTPKEVEYEKALEALSNQPPRTPEEMISKLTKLLYDLYSEKENSNRSMLLGKALALLYPDKSAKDIKKLVPIFERMLEVILSDVKEEVIGQERMAEAIPKLMNTRKKPEEYADLYPLALLAASFDASAPKPTAKSMAQALRHDVETFQQEFKSQFPRANRKQWDAMFEPCLKEVWKLAAN